MSFFYVYMLIHFATSKISKWCFDISSSESVFFPLTFTMAITVVPWKLHVKSISRWGILSYKNVLDKERKSSHQLTLWLEEMDLED